MSGSVNKDLNKIRQDLYHRRWPIRNQAVKDLGSDKSPEATSILLEVLQDSSPSRWWMRLLGEPYYQVGFIRRNAWKSLRGHVVEAEKFYPLLQKGLKDPYYEVRTHAFWTLKNQLARGMVQPDADLVANLFSTWLNEDIFEVVVAGIGVLSSLINRDQAFKMIDKHKRTKHWKVRDALLECIVELAHRNVLTESEQDSVLRRINTQSEYFKPVFLLRERKAQLEKAWKQPTDREKIEVGSP